MKISLRTPSIIVLRGLIACGVVWLWLHYGPPKMVQSLNPVILYAVPAILTITNLSVWNAKAFQNRQQQRKDSGVDL